ncbi:hypothetical protein V3O24_04525 [Methylobacter sp. Wu8]|uniref:hypothetical protein n=1 Tax=Methylobacter sp. Wu8 TaxID=3118457 RepID=UPI002F334DCE
MNAEYVFRLFDDVDEDYRMLVIDAAAVGCYLVKQGHEAAGRKLLHTAIKSAGLDSSLVQSLLADVEKSLAALAMHAEIRALINKKSV